MAIIVFNINRDDNKCVMNCGPYLILQSVFYSVLDLNINIYDLICEFASTISHDSVSR